MERSRAIKSPTVQYQLAGSKKVQQAMALPEAVEQFISDPETVKRIRSTFAGLYPLDHVSYQRKCECKCPLISTRGFLVIGSTSE